MKNDHNVQVIQCCLKIQSPVHVGCDEVYEPTGFVLDKKTDELIVFDPTAFIAGLPEEDRKAFSAICKEGTVVSILKIYKFMQNRPAEGRRVNVCSGFSGHLAHVLSLPNDLRKVQQELNKFSIGRTFFNPLDGRPCIPGSAVKGALRTAWLNRMAGEKPGLRTPTKPGPKGKPEADNKGLEKKLLDIRGNFIKEDPFRMVKVSDFQPVGDVPTRIVYAVNRKKKDSKEPSGPPQILEVVEPGACFVGSIRVEKPHPDAGISLPVSLAGLLKSLEFFGREKIREDRELSGVGLPVAEIPAGSGPLLRLGRHSGAESLTIDGHRSIKIMKGKGVKDEWSPTGATTFWLAAESPKPETARSLRPFGWVTMEKLDAAQVDQMEQTEKNWKRERDIRLAEKLDRERAERERLAEELRQRQETEARLAEEKRQREEAEARREAELAAMTPAQKDAAALDNPDIPMNEVHAVYGRMNKYDGEDKLVVARALKAYFVGRDKWTRKRCNSNEWQKVREIKTVLGENG